MNGASRSFAIHQLGGRQGSCVDAVHLIWTDGSERTYGASGGQQVEPFLLYTDEFMTTVYVWHESFRSRCLSFETNKQRNFVLGLPTNRAPDARYTARSGESINDLIWSAAADATHAQLLGVRTSPFAIRSIAGRHAHALDLVSFEMSDGTERHFGGWGGKESAAIHLEAHEFVTEVHWCIQRRRGAI